MLFRIILIIIGSCCLLLVCVLLLREETTNALSSPSTGPVASPGASVLSSFRAGSFEYGPTLIGTSGNSGKSVDIYFDSASDEKATKSLIALRYKILGRATYEEGLTEIILVGYFTGAQYTPPHIDFPELPRQVFHLSGWYVKAPFWSSFVSPEIGESPKRRTELLKSDFRDLKYPIQVNRNKGKTRYGFGQIDL
ncbi:MAG TPA: hypothetical protein VK970_03540 [Candidatus Methylacidiphilales bacterium]|nr:hypothetical protein [Candidatus Methylacidiphilales bacterium]